MSCCCSGMRKERGSLRTPQSTRRLTRLSSQGRSNLPKPLTGPTIVPLTELQPPALSSQQLIERMMEAEPPEIYLMKDMNRPLTEAHVMMSLTNLADKELVHMISWAKKIPGVCLALNIISITLFHVNSFPYEILISSVSFQF